MNPIVTQEIKEIMEAVHYRPAVSIFMPFEPKMSLKTELAYSLKIAANKIEHQLNQYYPGDLGMLVIQKLRAIIKDLNFNTHKKSVAIYVSPVFEKVLYLDINLEEKIIIDESFEIRDLVYSKKQLHKYLVLLLSSKLSRIYLGNTETFVRIVSDTPESVQAYANQIPERVGNFSDKSERTEILMDKFLHHIDKGLDIILNSYHLPLFVVGSERMLGHFKKLTKHSASVIEYIQGSYEEATLPALKKILEPHIADWKRVRQKDLLNQLDEAAGCNKLAIGINEVWTEAMSHKGRLLVVEKNYMFPAEHTGNPGMTSANTDGGIKFSYKKDAVDDVIEKVLENGGDVEFVDQELLKDHHHIALVKYY